jgi:hypothetical protein
MRVIHHLSLAVLVVLTSCSRSSPPTQSTQKDSNEIETGRTERPAAQPPAVEESVVTITASLPRTSFTLMSREIRLSKQQPSDSFLGARLVEVASDGTTTIEILKTTNRLRAAVGAFFTSSEYGRSGLQVLSASSERQEVRLERTWCQ